MAIVNKPPTPAQQPAPQPKTPCCCPACIGLDCLERPRFFANQFLTEADLNNEQSYLLAKNRLHNRYLHGAGVVCGLEVVCNDCDGTVTVRPGYAIDPCGNDVIVCDPTDFDLVKAIDECCRPKRRTRGCDPYAPPQPEGCKGVEQHWCITLEYLEREARGVMPVRSTSCGCGGSGNCGCGGKSHGSSKSGKHAGCSAPKMDQPQASSCEPSRILERFKLCVTEDKCSDERGTKGALQQRLAACTQRLQDFVNLVPQQYRTALGQLEAGTLTGLTPSQLYAVCCAVRAAAIQFLSDRAGNTVCGDLQQIPMCPTPPTTGTAQAYESAVGASVKTIVKLVVQSILQCMCSALLPPCPGDPCDDRIILACVTVRDGKVVDICNFSCRQYAGSFPALNYWLSAFPFVTQLRDALTRLCCRPAAVTITPPTYGTVGVPSAFFQAQAPPTEPYSFHKAAINQLDSILGKFSLDPIFNLSKPGAVAVGSFIGQSTEDAQAGLRQSQINMVLRRVESEAQIPANTDLLGGLVAYPGDQVVAYVVNDQVVALAPYDTAEALKDAQAQIAALRRDLDELKGTPR
jgi:hypothetical protein